VDNETHTCEICGKKYTIFGKNVLIQKDLLTGKFTCVDCAFDQYISEDGDLDG